MKRSVVIIQARMGSRRLRGKVLLPVGDETVISLMLARVKKAKKIAEIIIATTSKKADDILCNEAQQLGATVFRGQEDDVLDRFYQAAKDSNADVVVRLTADCPLIDGCLIDTALEEFSSGAYDYFSNVIERSFPDGLDIEIFSMETLRSAAHECKDEWSREHVTPYMRTGSDLRVAVGDYRVGHLRAKSDFSHLRWTLDTASDYEFLCAISKHNIRDLGWLDIVSLLTQNSDLLMWNRGITERQLHHEETNYWSHAGFQKSTEHLSRALKSIPVGSQTFSKSYLGWVIGHAPIYSKSGSGAIITDLDGNKYIDYMMALLPVVLGYADPFVDAAVVKQMMKGNSLSLSGTLEAELAEKLVSIIPCAEMVRYGKNGSDATTAAIRLARAYTGREKIVVCGYHGWHDWYIGTTPKSLGVPPVVSGLSLAFPFNDAEALSDLLKRHGNDVAAVVIEPTGKIAPCEGFLAEVRRLCDSYGSILVFDEVISGFRINIGGAQAHYDVIPDLAAFGKAMANGYPLSALVGSKKIMTKMEDIFFSATFGGELSSLAAALATIEKIENTQAIQRMHSLGDTLMASLNKSIENAGLGDMITYSGEGWWPRVVLKETPIEPEKTLALMRQEYAAQNLLIASGLNFCLAHDDEFIVQQTLARAERVFEKLFTALNSSNPEGFIRGKIATSDFDVRGHMRSKH